MATVITATFQAVSVSVLAEMLNLSLAAAASFATENGWEVKGDTVTVPSSARKQVPQQKAQEVPGSERTCCVFCVSFVLLLTGASCLQRSARFCQSLRIESESFN